MMVLDWIAVVFRIMAVWLVVGVLVGLPGLVANWWSTQELGEQAALMTASFRVNILGQATALVLAVFLWLQSKRLARWVWQGSAEQSSTPGLTAADLQQAVFAGLGAYILILGLPNLAELAAGYYSLPAGIMMEQHFEGQMRARAIGVGIQMVAGLGLVLGAGGLVNLTRRVRARKSDADKKEAEA